MNNLEYFVDAGNIKFKTNYRDSMYNVLKEKDESGLFTRTSEIFYDAFAIGYHFDETVPIAPHTINHVNLVSLDRDVKELMAQLVLKRKADIEDPKKLWKEVEMYAEYGIQVLFKSWETNHKMLNIDDILEGE